MNQSIFRTHFFRFSLLILLLIGLILLFPQTTIICEALLFICVLLLILHPFKKKKRIRQVVQIDQKLAKTLNLPFFPHNEFFFSSTDAYVGIDYTNQLIGLQQDRKQQAMIILPFEFFQGFQLFADRELLCSGKMAATCRWEHPFKERLTSSNGHTLRLRILSTATPVFPESLVLVLNDGPLSYQERHEVTQLIERIDKLSQSSLKRSAYSLTRSFT